MQAQIENCLCGGEAALWDDTVVRCKKCKIFGYVMDTPESAINEWNRTIRQAITIRGGRLKADEQRKRGRYA